MSLGIVSLLFLAFAGPSAVSWLVCEIEFWRGLRARNRRFAEYERLKGERS